MLTTSTLREIFNDFRRPGDNSNRSFRHRTKNKKSIKNEKASFLEGQKSQLIMPAVLNPKFSLKLKIMLGLLKLC